MKRLAIFSSYNLKDQLPNYVQIWLLELRKYFEVILVTNERFLKSSTEEWLQCQDINLQMVQNEGYDFGMWGKMLKQVDLAKYDELLLCNDSCFLIKPIDHFLKWSEEQKADVLGLTNSEQYNLHLQSFFILYKKPTFSFLLKYFQQHGIIHERHNLINTYELGLSKFLQKNGFKFSAQFDYQNYAHINTSAQGALDLLKDGCPIIKKKVVYNTFKKDEKNFLENYNYQFLRDWKTILKNYSQFNVDYLLQEPIINILQVYYEQTQKSQLLDCTIPYINQELTPFFENEIIRQLYYQDKIVGDYFGLLSWKFTQKNETSFEIQELQEKDFDLLIAPIGLNRYHDVLVDSEKCHPGFSRLFKYVLNQIGMDFNIKPQLGIYQNAVIARTEIFRDYCEKFLLPTMQILEELRNESYYHKILWSNSRYEFNPNLKSKLLEFLGVDYYPYHTFICERLWSVYYHMHKNKLKLEFLTRKKGTRNFDSEKNNRICIFSKFDEKELRVFSQYCEARFGEKIQFVNSESPRFDLLQCFEQMNFVAKGLKNKKIILLHSNLFYDHIEYFVEFFPNIQLFLPQNPKHKPANWDEIVQRFKKLPLELRLINPQRDFHFVNALKIK